jgi:hypothetical protein
MSRDVNGNYTLPVGNPVVSGQPISSTVHNSTNNDIATALTDSLSRSGLGGMLTALPFVDGTLANPSITFTNELTSGIFRPGAGELAISILGALKVTWGSAEVGIEVTPKVRNVDTNLYRLLDEKTNTIIQGQWQFPYIGNAVLPNVVGHGGMLTADNALQTSGLVRVVTVAPGVGDGLPGDIWLVV